MLQKVGTDGRPSCIVLPSSTIASSTVCTLILACHVGSTVVE